MTKQQIIKEISTPILRPYILVFVAFVTCFLAFTFVWIWFYWSIAWKIGLTGILGGLISVWLLSIVNEVIEKFAEEEATKRKLDEALREFEESFK